MSWSVGPKLNWLWFFSDCSVQKKHCSVWDEDYHGTSGKGIYFLTMSLMDSYNTINIHSKGKISWYFHSLQKIDFVDLRREKKEKYFALFGSVGQLDIFTNFENENKARTLVWCFYPYFDLKRIEISLVFIHGAKRYSDFIFQ